MRLRSLLVAVLAFAALGSNAAGQASAWLNPAFAYRSPVNLANPNATPLTQFQANVKLTSGTFDFTRAQSNGADLRVTASDGATAIPFWIESWNGSTASIWVKIPSVPAAGTTIYLYYGNSSATSASSGSSTFEFFDDFEGTTSSVPGYFDLSAPTLVLSQDQAWETSPPHTLSVSAPGYGGYTYWGYYGTYDTCDGVGLARSNNLVNWTKYGSAPLFTNARWPVVQYVSGIFYLFYEANYCSGASYIAMALSFDGVHFGSPSTVVAAESGYRNQNPYLFYNSADGRWYLYYYRGNDQNSFDIRVRSASSLSGLASASSTVLLHSTSKLAAPSVYLSSGTYFLSTEGQDANGLWVTNVYSSSSPSSGFTLLPGNPVLATDEACMFQQQFGSTLYNFECKHANGVWSLQLRTASLSAGRVNYRALNPSLWSVSGGGTWAVIPDTQPDGSSGHVAQAQGTGRQVALSSYSGTDYTLHATGRQLLGNVWGLGVNASSNNNLYSINLYSGLDNTNNLFSYGWFNNAGVSADTQLLQIAAGPVVERNWYQLIARKHGNTLDLSDGNHSASGTNSTLASGKIALYAETGTNAEWDNVFVRKYAPVDLNASVAAQQTQGVSSVTLTPVSVLGGSSSQGTVALSTAAPTGGTVVQLSSTSSAAVVPSSITVPGGSTSANFTVTTAAVSTATTATVSATAGGQGSSATLLISPMLSTMSVSPATLEGGYVSNGSIGLFQAAPAGGVNVALNSSSSAATVPATVAIAAGQSSASFAISTTAVSNSGTAQINASYAGSTLSSTLTLLPSLTALSVSPSSVTSGSIATGTVTLQNPAKTGGAVVALSSDNAAVSVPASITIPAGSASATFTATANTVSSATTATLTASYGAASQAATLSVQPKLQGWIGANWLYRSAVSINNTSGATLTNFQVKVNLGSTFDFSRIASGGADLRFTAADGVTALPFWVESISATTKSGVIWVRVPSVPTTGTSIYMYYGNASASAASDGPSTFDFFDGFDGASVDSTKWTASGGSWTIARDADQNGSTSGVVKGVTSGRQILLSSFTGGDYVVDAWAQQTAGRVWALGVRSSGIANLYSINFYADLDSSNNLYAYSWVNSTSDGATRTLGSAATGTVDLNSWYHFTARVHGNTIDVQRNGVGVLSVTDSALASGGISLGGENGTSAEWNNVFVRKYASVDPSASVGPTTLSDGSVVGGVPATARVSRICLAQNEVNGGLNDPSTCVLPAGVVVPAGHAVAVMVSYPSHVTLSSPTMADTQFNTYSYIGTQPDPGSSDQIWMWSSILKNPLGAGDVVSFVPPAQWGAWNLYVYDLGPVVSNDVAAFTPLYYTNTWQLGPTAATTGRTDVCFGGAAVNQVPTPPISSYSIGSNFILLDVANFHASWSANYPGKNLITFWGEAASGTAVAPQFTSSVGLDNGSAILSCFVEQ